MGTKSRSGCLARAWGSARSRQPGPQAQGCVPLWPAWHACSAGSPPLPAWSGCFKGTTVGARGRHAQLCQDSRLACLRTRVACLSLWDSGTVREVAGARVSLGTPGSNPSIPGCVASPSASASWRLFQGRSRPPRAGVCGRDDRFCHQGWVPSLRRCRWGGVKRLGDSCAVNGSPGVRVQFPRPGPGHPSLCPACPCPASCPCPERLSCFCLWRKRM